MEKMEIRSMAFVSMGEIPKKYTCSGMDINPPLEISKIPKNTISLALIMDDPDAPMGTFTHWVVWNIGTDGIIPENRKPGIEGVNDGGKAHYMGPCPPSGRHRYFFRVFALDTCIDLPQGSTRQALVDAMKGRIIGKGELVGTFSR